MSNLGQQSNISTLHVPKTITLHDGRTLAYIECGDTEGTPVFHFHGHPGSRLESLIADKAARSAGVRLIGIDRPGMGFSDFKRGRCLLDWPDDVLELADALEINQFSVQGASGGGPYVIACAYRLADRLLACGVIAGLGPIHLLGTKDMMLTNRIQFALACRMPWLVQILLWAYLGRYGKYVDDEEKLELLGNKMAQGMSNSANNPDLPKLYVQETLEAFRQGSHGAAYDASLFTQPWGFELEDIKFEKIYLWHGERDVHVPIEMAHFLEKKIPQCKVRYFADEDHMAVVFNHLEEVMTAMSQDKRV